jgi:hypothetical protein
VTGGWRKLHNEEPHDLYSSSDIIRVIKTKMMRWAGYVERLGEMKNAYKLYLESLKGGDHSEDTGVDGSIILKWILGK